MMKSKKEKAPNPFARGEIIRARIMAALIFIPLIYSLLWYFGAPWVNAYWQKDMQCTIEKAMVHNSGTRSYSSNEYVWMKSPDCGKMRYHGPSYGLTDKEISRKINEQVGGKKVHLKAGVWKFPIRDSVHVYKIDGLKLKD